MMPMLGRRHFMGGALAAGALGAGPAKALTVFAGPLADLETKSGGRLGVWAICSGRDAFGPVSKNWPVASPWVLGSSRDIMGRFAFCSSFKMSLAALVLDGAEKGEWRLSEQLAFSEADILSNSPVTRAKLHKGRMSMLELAEAAQKFSDNGAANLLLRRVGGPDRLNRFWAGLGDKTSRLDDYEPALNRVPLGSLSNTTTPHAMAINLVKMFREDGIAPKAAATLKAWMHDTTTGAKRLRAGLPADWWAGDKTGTGLPSDIRGTYVDLAWVEPPKLPPFAIAAFYQPPAPTPDGDPKAEAVLAQVGRIVVQAIVSQRK